MLNVPAVTVPANVALPSPLTSKGVLEAAVLYTLKQGALGVVWEIAIRPVGLIPIPVVPGSVDESPKLAAPLELIVEVISLELKL